MGKFGEYAMFGLKVAAAILVINQIGPLRDMINKDYFTKA